LAGNAANPTHQQSGVIEFGRALNALGYGPCAILAADLLRGRLRPGGSDVVLVVHVGNAPGLINQVCAAFLFVLED
jgi:hypothetical protein